MRQKHWGRRLAAGLLLGAAAFALAGCGPSGGADSGAEDLALFEIHPMEGYERADGTFEVQDASGQTVAVMAADDALRDYPARPPEGEDSDTGHSEIARKSPGWDAVDGDLERAQRGDEPVPGAAVRRRGRELDPYRQQSQPGVRRIRGGILNDQVGFVCSRHFLTTGPEILWTRDGGASWSPLELPIPEEYQGSVMDAYSPRFQDGEVRFPVADPGRDFRGKPVCILYQHRPGALDLERELTKRQEEPPAAAPPMC